MICGAEPVRDLAAVLVEGESAYVVDGLSVAGPHCCGPAPQNRAATRRGTRLKQPRGRGRLLLLLVRCPGAVRRLGTSASGRVRGG